MYDLTRRVSSVIMGVLEFQNFEIANVGGSNKRTHWLNVISFIVYVGRLFIVSVNTIVGLILTSLLINDAIN